MADLAELTPEQLARQRIDSLLTAAGWTIQNKAGFNRNAAIGIAVREFSLPNGEADYLLFVGGKAAGVIEAKPAGHTLGGVEVQSTKYMVKLHAHLAKWADQLIFHYESTGDETLFRDTRDPNARSRRVFAFHTPGTLHAWLKEQDTLRARLQHLPPLQKTGLRDCQIEAIEGLETSLSQDRPRALIQMATGAGKTFTACTFSWRLLKSAGARRILFLVDRNNLGDQTLKEYQNYDPPGSGRKFVNTYIVQHLHSNRIDPDAKVVITTIQRLYSMLRGQELDEANEEKSAFETWANNEGEIPPIEYNPDIPIDTFDFIVTDECHRSIYGLWRQVLEYFDAHLIGLTATPSMHTLGFFNQNLVSEYPYEQSVIDGVNVGFEVYRIRTRVTEHGGTVDAAYAVPVRDRRTRAIRYRQLEDDLPYIGRQIDSDVTVPNQIRAILQHYRENLFTDLFPGRSGQWVAESLKEWKQVTEFQAATDFLFPSLRNNGDVPVWPDTLLKKVIRPAVKRAGITGKIIGWHTFRHSLATNLRALGVDVKVTQELLRHANARTTLDLYTQAISSQKREANARVVEMILPAENTGRMLSTKEHQNEATKKEVASVGC
jgi:type I restriction enzyme R subunit